MSNRNINVSSSVLRQEIFSCREAIQTIDELKRLLEESKQSAQKNGWYDNNYKKAEKRIDYCIEVIDKKARDNIVVLLKNLNEVLRVVLEYERYGGASG